MNNSNYNIKYVFASLPWVPGTDPRQLKCSFFCLLPQLTLIILKQVCCHLQICSSEVKCVCDKFYMGEDCSSFFPYKSTSKPDVDDGG